jgi:hypothetical protein
MKNITLKNKPVILKNTDFSFEYAQNEADINALIEKSGYDIILADTNTENLDITNKDIWLYLKENKWQNSYGLTLSDMTSDIINVDLNEILKYKEGL